MCVIISRKPGVIIPFQKFENACITNPDGFGISVFDRGKLETIKGYEVKGNDAEKIYKLVDDAINEKVFIHLRYSTRGKKSEENCHPFPVVTIDEDGYDSFFMHNGTLSGYYDSTGNFSDSYVFARDILKPLIRLADKGTALKAGILEPIVKTVLSNIAGTNNTLVLYDSNGNEVIIDPGKRGFFYDGWWASNEYSFNRMHRSYSGNPTTGKVHTFSPPGTSTSKAAEGTCAVPFQPTNNNVSSTEASSKPSSSSTGLKQECHLVGSAINQASTKNRAVGPIIPPEKRWTFCELANVDSLDNVVGLTEEDISDIVTETPEAATLLIMDLIYELYINKNAKRDGTNG